MSSFDIESIVYRMNEGAMQFPPDQDIQLAGSCWLWLRQIKEDANLRQSLLVPDEKRAIFAEGKASLAQLEALEAEFRPTHGRHRSGSQTVLPEVSRSQN